MNGRGLIIASALVSLLMPCVRAADSAAVPGPGFTGDRYANLWTKSPFAIATPDAPATSEDYQLVGMAQFDGVSYVSLVDKQNQEHFVLASNKPVKNLTLVSISHGTSGAGGSAIIQRNGETLTLKQEVAAAPTGGAPGNMPGNAPGGVPPQPMFIPQGMPQANSAVGGMPPVFVQPRARFHNPTTVVPQRPPQH